MSLTTINESPPGQGVPGAPVPPSYQVLTVMCGENKDIRVDINYLNYLSTLTFERDDGNGVDVWYLVHTWTKTWYEGSKSGSVFVNLRTGERHDTCLLSWWRGYLSISKDGKLILLNAGITASSARQTNVIDISDWDNIHLIHYSEDWNYENKNVIVSIEENGNDVVFKYYFTDDQFKYYYLGDKTTAINTDVNQDLEPTKEVVVVRRKNIGGVPKRVFLVGVDQLDSNSLVSTKYGCVEYIDVSNMSIVSETVNEIEVNQPIYSDSE